jgi:orotidine-5'-phosphate decarboxylase
VIRAFAASALQPPIGTVIAGNHALQRSRTPAAIHEGTGMQGERTSRPELPPRERLIVALDVPDVAQADRLVDRLGDAAVFYKIGMQLQFNGGLDYARRLVDQGKKVFLDSKLYDIDETVALAVANIARMGVSFLTIHGVGATVRAAVRGRGDGPLRLLAVTALTSLDAGDLAELGIAGPVGDYVVRRAQNAAAAGCDGVIASGQEASRIRDVAGDRLLIVTPGIRSAGSAHHDQKRVATPAAAIAAGADYLVVGREVTQSSDPAAAAENVVRQIEAGLERLN